MIESFTAKQIKKAFWETFHGAGEIWLPDSEGHTATWWSIFEENLRKGCTMKSTSSKHLIITIALDEKEARWLMGLVQNYLSSGEEPEEYQIHRCNLFDSIKEQLDD